MRRPRRTPEEYAAFKVDIAVTLGDVGRALDFERRIEALAEQSVGHLDAICRGEYHTKYATRGERWRDTYSLRRAEEQLAQHRAAIAALERITA